MEMDSPRPRAVNLPHSQPSKPAPLGKVMGGMGNWSKGGYLVGMRDGFVRLLVGGAVIWGVERWRGREWTWALTEGGKGQGREERC